jgi:hypothetical protein
MFLSGQQVIEAHDATDEERRDIVKRIYDSKDPKEINTLLLKNGIDYVLFYGKSTLPIVSSAKLQTREVFGNEAVTILKVNK